MAGWLIDPSPSLESRGHRLRRAALLAAAAIAPDLDLLIGGHRGPSHGIGAAVFLGALVWMVRARGAEARREGAGRFAFASGVAYASHTLLDWLGSDNSPPIGVMALWPLSREYYESTLHVFMSISRRYWLPDFWTHNLRAVARELAILGPAAALVWFARRRRPGTRGATRREQ